jgi:hypothetical protein
MTRPINASTAVRSFDRLFSIYEAELTSDRVVVYRPLLTKGELL